MPFARRRTVSPAASSWLSVSRVTTRRCHALQEDVVGPRELGRAQHVSVEGGRARLLQAHVQTQRVARARAASRCGAHDSASGPYGPVLRHAVHVVDTRASERIRGDIKAGLGATDDPVRPAQPIRERVLVRPVEVVESREAARRVARPLSAESQRPRWRAAPRRSRSRRTPCSSRSCRCTAPAST